MEYRKIVFLLTRSPFHIFFFWGGVGDRFFISGYIFVYIATKSLCMKQKKNLHKIVNLTKRENKIYYSSKNSFFLFTFNVILEALNIGSKTHASLLKKEKIAFSPLSRAFSCLFQIFTVHVTILLYVQRRFQYTFIIIRKRDSI